MHPSGKGSSYKAGGTLLTQLAKSGIVPSAFYFFLVSFGKEKIEEVLEGDFLPKES